MRIAAGEEVVKQKRMTKIVTILIEIAALIVSDLEMHENVTR
jgi:hypothetical protein